MLGVVGLCLLSRVVLLLAMLDQQKALEETLQVLMHPLHSLQALLDPVLATRLSALAALQSPLGSKTLPHSLTALLDLQRAQLHSHHPLHVLL